jgi:hypothetical protein
MVEPTPSNPIKKDKAKIPQSELEFNNKTLEPVWGKNEINIELDDKFRKKYFQFDHSGNIIVNPTTQEPILTTEGIWAQLGILTRDVRSSNLRKGNAFTGELDEINYCEMWLQLSADLLSEGYEECAMIALGRAAIRLELGLSRDGFFRKRMGTYTQENIAETREPPKHYFGMGKQKNY